MYLTQVNLRSVGRKRFARLSEDEAEIQVEENVPWGEDTLFTLEFREEANKYAVHTCNNRYLVRDGRLAAALQQECLFACEYHGGYIALRDQQVQRRNGVYGDIFMSRDCTCLPSGLAPS